MAPVQRVISDLIEQYRGKPALVIGGGPSVLPDLVGLTHFQPAVVFSANEHGCRQNFFAVDYIVHEDKIHVMKRDERGRHLDMAEYLRRFNKPLISRWASADVRLAGWKFKSNSGAMAVAVAAALQCSPIVVTGLDYWATGRRYFHDGADVPKPKRQYAWQIAAARTVAPRGADRRLSPLRQFVGDAHIRPMSGLLLTAWPAYDPREKFELPARTESPEAAPYRALRSFHWSNYDTVSQGTVIKLTKSEAEPLLRAGSIAAIGSPV